MGIPHKEKEFFDKLEKLWEKTPKPLRIFLVWLKWIVIVGLIILLFGTYGFTEKFNFTEKFDIDISREHQADYKCPADHDTLIGYFESIAKHTKSISINNPGITAEELDRKLGEWIDSVECYEIYIDKDFGFSFEYQSHLFIDDSLPFENGFPLKQLVIIPNSWREDINLPFTAIKIIVDENNSLLTPMEWLKTPESNYDTLTDDYEISSVDGQQAVSIDNGLWVIFNTPDQKKRIQIRILIDYVNGAEPLYKEIKEIIQSFSFIES